MKKFVALLALWPVLASAQVFNLFQPANGVLKGATTTYVTTAAASTDIVSLWTGTCNATTFMRGDGTCSTGLSSPFTVANGGTGAATLTGIIKGNGTSAFTAATQVNGTALFIPAADANSLGVGTGVLTQGGITGTNNSGFGIGALAAISTGSRNVAVGYNALTTDAGGSENTAVGYQALAAQANGNNNTAVGRNALNATTGSNNTGVGYAALNVATGSDNTTVGQLAGSLITSGTSNIILGENGNITTGSSNIIIGNVITTTTAGSSNQLDIGDSITATDYTVGPVKLKGGVVSAGTTFTISSGCPTVSALTGGATAGSFATTTTGVCTPVIVLPTAPNGWACFASDVTTTAVFKQTAKSTTSCTVSGTTTSGDTVVFGAIGY